MNSQRSFLPAGGVLRAGLAFFALCGVRVLDAQTVPTPASSAPGDEVVLSPFVISADKDNGYQASNSVSATRIAIPIQDLPFTISALTRQFLTDVNDNDLLGALRYAPGVSGASSDFTGGNAQYVVNGFPQYPLRNGFLSSVNIADTVNIERVEVVHGPASLLYGAIQPGGTVNFITKTPKPKAFAEFTVEAGSYDFYRFETDINQPLIKDELLFRFNGEYQNLFQWIKPYQSRDFDVAPTVTWQTSKNSELTVSYEMFHRRESPQNFKKIDVLDPNTFQDLGVNVIYPNPLPHSFNFLSNRDWRRTDQEMLDIGETLRLGEHWFAKGVFEWTKGRVDELYTGVSNLVANADGTVPLEQRRVRYQLDRNKGHTTQLDLAGDYDFGFMKWKPLFGLHLDSQYQYEIQRTADPSQYPPAWNLYNPSTWDYNANLPVSALPLGYEYGIRSSDQAFYTVQNLSFLHDQLNVIGGVRYSIARSQQEDNPAFGPEGWEPQYRTTTTTPQFGAGYKIVPGLMLYGSYSESFQPQPFGLITNDLPSGPAKPLIGKGYEAGIKTQLLDGRLSGTIGVFDITNTNIIQNVVGAFNPVTGVATSSTIQAGEAKSRGATIELFYSPAANWQIYATATWDHAYISKNPEDPSLIGTPLQYSTRHLASLWLRHDFSGGLKGLYIAGGPNYTGPKSFLGPGNSLMLKGYTLWNAVVAYDGAWGEHKYTVKLNVDNLTDIYYDNSNYDRGLPRRFIGSFTLHY